MQFDSLYIGASSCVSAQDTFGHPEWYAHARPLEGTSQRAFAPDYKKFLDPMATRRMSKVLKNTLLTAKQALEQAKLDAPDAVVTATAWGCQEDTGKFLDAIETMGEELLSPTAFIQSTHNTIGGLVALSVKCNGYNNTVSHDYMSFETALLDAALLMREDDTVQSCYVGGIDELTDLSSGIFERASCLRTGYTISEAAVSFLLQRDATGNTIQLTAVSCLTDEEEWQALIQDRSPDVVLSSDKINVPLPVLDFRTYGGEFSTAAAFGLFMAAELLTKPEAARHYGFGALRRIAVANAYPGSRYSYLELQAC